jgi:hypothetical protein
VDRLAPFNVVFVVAVMRIAGHAFLIVGFLLCISIAWAAIGFFAMGFGLIFLLIAEERKKAKKASTLRSRCTETQFGSIEAVQPLKATTLNATQVWQDQTGLHAYEPNQVDEWESLVRSDQDLSRVVTNLTPFGQKYVEQLAKAYVAFNDKAFLPMILNMVIASARKDADLRSVDAFVGPNDQSSASSSQPDRLREIASLTTLKSSSEDGRDRWENGREAIQPKSMDSFVIPLQRAPLSGSGQRSESPAHHDDVTAEADVFSPVQPPVQEIEPGDVDNLKSLFDQLVLSSSKGKES